MQAEHAKIKASFDKASSEVADYKRKERERMSDDEKKKSESEERERYDADLERRLALVDYSSELDDITDAKAKDKIVELFADGKIVDALKEFKKYRAKDKVDMEKRIKDELMKTNPQSNPQSNSVTYKTKDEILAIKDTALRQKAIAENLNLFQ
jgi:hypothetical protein